jgi:hypothetical protein
VRAGSALAVLRGGGIAVVQDDASFLAIVDPRTGIVTDVPFPGGAPRQFDDGRGTKAHKLDLEAAFVTPDGALVALGSGSSARRERVAYIERAEGPSPEVRIAGAPALYAALRAARDFSGSELNVEGAAITGADLVLFQRGNGAPRVIDGAELGPVDATARLALPPLLAYLRGDGPVPPLRGVRPWDLGASGGRRLTFTDGAARPGGGIAFLACAEDSPDATRDGPVTAVMIGRLDDEAGTCELGPILDERGEPLLDKAEGLAFDPDEPTRARVVTDRDDPELPAELLVLELGPAWRRR